MAKIVRTRLFAFKRSVAYTNPEGVGKGAGKPKADRATTKKKRNVA